MKHKKIKIAALAIVTASLLGGILYSEFGTKKSYDYSEYYVESKPSKQQRIIKMIRELLKRSFLYLYSKDTFNKLGYKAKINTHTTSYIN